MSDLKEKSVDEDLIEFMFPIFVFIVIMGIFAVIGCVYVTYTSYYTKTVKDEVVRELIIIENFKRPASYKLRYRILRTGQIQDHGAKSCNDGKNADIVVGATYAVDIQYVTKQYKDEPPTTLIMTGGCDIIRQFPKVAVS